MATIEKAILGTFLKNNFLLKDTILRPKHFEEEQNKQLFAEMQKLTMQGRGVDVVTLSTIPSLSEIGGVSYLNDIQSFANVEKFDEYESIILEKWKEREKKNILTTATFENWSIEKVTAALDKLNETKSDDYTPIQEAVAEVAELPWTKKQERRGVSTGIKELDKMTNGFTDSELTVIAARPSVGKTDLLLHFSKQAGWLGYLPVIFSLEMPTRSLVERLIASTGSFNRTKLRNPYKELTDAQKDKWTVVLSKVAETNIQVFDNAGQSVSEMRAKVRKLIHQFNKKPVIFIDYLTLIKPKFYYNGNMHQQVTEISSDLKEMAKEFDCPVVTLAQLNRSVEQRSDKRPTMADIRESGSIEQIADVIMLLYREKYYNPDSDDNTMEIIVGKNRTGPIGTARPLYNEFTGEIKDDSQGFV